MLYGWKLKFRRDLINELQLWFCNFWIRLEWLFVSLCRIFYLYWILWVICNNRSTPENCLELASWFYIILLMCDYHQRSFTDLCVAQMFSNSILPYHGESSLRFIIPWEDGFPSDSAVSLDILVLETVQSITILFRTVLEEKEKRFTRARPLYLCWHPVIIVILTKIFMMTVIIIFRITDNHK